jgi:hypothetical protein
MSIFIRAIFLISFFVQYVDNFVQTVERPVASPCVILMESSPAGCSRFTFPSSSPIAATKNLRGEAKVLASFEIKGEKVYGVSIVKGKFNTNDEIEVFRESNSFGKAKIVSLKFRAKTISEAKKGEECGMLLSPPLDIRAGDVVKCIL